MKKFTLYILIREVVLGVIYGAFMVIAGVVIAGFLIYRYQTPKAEELLKHKMAETSIIYDRTGMHELYEIHGEENRKVLTHGDIPDLVRAATIAAEDKSFYKHFGVDPIATARAFEVNMKNHAVLQGGSTITQQLVRNVFLSREKTLWRKYIEAILALKIERKYDKDEILDAYLNQVPYGSNAYGVQSAAEIFFGKNASKLTLDEAALLAALPKATTYYSPYREHRKELVFRQKEIIKKMAELGYVPEDEADRSLATDTLAKLKPFREKIEAPHFVFYVIDQLERQYGKEFLETGGLKIYTTLDYDMQKIAETTVEEGVARNFKRGASNAGLIALDPKTGDILAMVGSRDYFDKADDGEVNVTLSPRQPGSAFKPIVYATAFEQGFQPETRIMDEETNFGPDGTGRDYIPRNYDGQFHGEMTMRESLARSLNIPAVRTLATVGIEAAKNMARRLGITTLSDERRYGLSMAIGGAEVKLLDLTSAFSVFANDGKKNPPRAVKNIFDGKNFRIYGSEVKEERMIDSQIARKIDSILSDNEARSAIFGPNSPLNFGKGRVAAKTGTTQDFKDAWTVGFTPTLAVGIWVGNNDGRLMAAGSDGVFVAAPIWRSYMDKVLVRYPEELFIAYQPANIGKEMVLGDEKWKNEEKDKGKKKKKKHG